MPRIHYSTEFKTTWLTSYYKELALKGGTGFNLSDELFTKIRLSCQVNKQ